MGSIRQRIGRALTGLRRPVGRLGLVVLVGLIVTGPWLLFFDPVAFLRPAHIARDPEGMYRLYSDDFAYVAGSRTFSTACSNLFVPHNTHIVPSWRILTWLLTAAAGSLENLPRVLARACYGILAAVMLLTGRLIARETGRVSLGLAAAICAGTTSLLLSDAVWYSAGQTLWAGFGILATLWYCQCWRRSASRAALGLASASAVIAGGFWTIGHMAGPVGSIYLWCDGRGASRRAAAIPLAATILALAISFGLGAGKIDSTISFHGRTTREAARPVAGLFHTAQAIPENLVLANLGLRARTTPAQGVLLTLAILGSWAVPRWRQGRLAAVNPLEAAGLGLMLGSYLVEWTVRGYFDFEFLRTLNIGYIVPWYDTIPHIGAVLFLFGWISGPRQTGRRPALLGPAVPVTRGGAVGLIALSACLILLHAPRVDLLWRKTAPALLPAEQRKYPIISLQSLRATALLLERAQWQRRHLHRLDQAQQTITRLGLDRSTVRAVFGRIDLPDLPSSYDGIGLLVFPVPPRPADPHQVRKALEPFLFMEPQPRPDWLSAQDDWPPSTQPEELRLQLYGVE